jgi:5-methylthioadenosine/S-adenosylhomocysteine deaminase
MFKEMKLAYLLQAGSNNDPSILSIDNIIDMACVNGAKALGRNDTGLIEVGYKADLAVIDLNKPHLYPHNDLVSSLIFNVNGSDVCMTIVDGNILFDNGKFTTLNKNKILKAAIKSKEYLFN